jgi:hypothetical protein
VVEVARKGVIGMTDSCVYFWALKASDCAAWVQAWGSIAALAVSIGVWWWQASRSRDDRVQAEVERLGERVAPALGLLDGMLDEFQNLVSELEGQLGSDFYGWGGSSHTKFQALLGEYLKVEAHLLPDAELALKAAQAKELGEVMRNWAASFEAWLSTGVFIVGPNNVDEAKRLLAALKECRDALRRRLVERTYMIINPDFKKSALVNAE